MTTKVAIRKNWRELYEAALAEPDCNKVSERVAKAEWALAIRAQELSYEGEGHLEERLAVDGAISVMQTLRRTTSGQTRK